MSSSGGANESTTVVTPASPAVGADWSFTLTKAGLLVSVYALFVASAAVAARVPTLRITNDTGSLLGVFSYQGTIPAGAGIGHTWAPGLTTVAQQGNWEQIAIPSYVMGVGWTIATQTNSKDAGDQWSNIALVFSDR